LEFRLKRDPVVIIVIAMVVALMLVFGFKLTRHTTQSSEVGSPVKNGLAPDFTLQTLEGKTIKLSDLRGKPVVLNFWATWCAPCKIEMPWFVDLQKKYDSTGVQFLGVAMDDASTKDIAEFAQSMNVNYPILIGKEAVGDAYGGVQFLPETFYIGRDGKIVDKAFGLKGRGEIEDAVKKIIGSGPVAHK
jgi:cytochrome c biogenesis protein CcmG/thiol:disulfide interchange protein DsbE